MNYGFLKVAAAVPTVRVADCEYNCNQIEQLILQAETQGVEIVVPVTDDRVENHDEEDGPAKRQDDAKENLEIPASIDARGLLKFRRDGILHVGADDDDIEDGNAAGDDDGPNRVEHPEIRDEEVGRNHATTDEHREGQKDVEEFPAFEVRAAEGIGAEHLEGNLDDGAEERVEQGV